MEIKTNAPGYKFCIDIDIFFYLHCISYYSGRESSMHDNLRKTYANKKNTVK